MNRPVFILAAVGSMIGLGNIWKFPYLTFKHGGAAFIFTYLAALIVVGIPMLILELTLGQKMQRGSVGALRGITPRLGGAGWAASFSGFITCVVYNILLGLSLYYLFNTGSLPWSQENYQRVDGCDTAITNRIPNTELFLYMNVTNVLGENDCERYDIESSISRFSSGLFVCVLITWILVFLMIIKGAKSIQFGVLVTATLPFLFLIILIFMYTSINSEVEGFGIQFYMGQEKFPYPPTPSGEITYQDASINRDSLIQDALLQVFFSVGVCYGVMFAYGSYNPTKKPVIMDSLIIAFLDFVFSILAGFITFSAIGALQKLGIKEYNQTNSVGLTFIAMPALAAHDDGKYQGHYIFFTLFMFVAGIDSAVSYAEAFVTNIVDQYKWNRQVAAAVVCVGGIILSAIFCTSFGWVLFDLVDHYISSYIVIGVGLMQAISVGWLFEKETTAAVSPGHAASLKWMGIIYWFFTITIAFYANFGFKDFKAAGLISIFITTCIALAVSKKVSRLPFRSWYHEIVLCGVDKVSMSITSISNEDGSRSWWMVPFEAYFGVCIKFVTPVALIWLLCENLEADLASPYAEQPELMQMYSSIIVFITIILIFGPMFVCDYPEIFDHDVNLEFMADNIYAMNLRKKSTTPIKQLTQKSNQVEQIEMNESSKPIQKPELANEEDQANVEE